MGATGTAGVGPSFLPAGYTGTPFAALKLPGRINAADYDRGGAGVGWCHNAGGCASGTARCGHQRDSIGTAEPSRKTDCIPSRST